MRILFTGPASAGHVFPMVPFAQALRAAGHEVLFAGQRPLDPINTSGFPVVEIGDGRTLEELFIAWRQGPMTYGDASLSPEELMDLAAGGFVYAGRTTVDDLLATASGWGADLLVHATFQTAAPLVAAKLKIPLVMQNYGIPSGRGMVERFTRHQADLYEQYGVAGPAESTAINVGPFGGDPDGLRARYLPYNGTGVVPIDVLRPSERRRVLVTLGSVVAKVEGVGGVTRLIEAAAEVDAEFLLAVGDADISPLGTLPANVRPMPWIPLVELVRHTDAVVHHGGAGTTLTTLNEGLPQLVLPQGADNFIVADALTEVGIALRSTSDTVDVATLERLLTDPELRATAKSVQADNLALPTPASFVPTFEALAGRA
ncbi:glycosyltransferase [Kitasatospora sp. NPDC051170]|uniref:glycosyltransferase n=1 Tax=Kitasatospora sp. NPDC051170 TaxID=3364056 RepID=UPI00379AB7BB